ncbi:hypothetical protein LYZ37_21000 [Vibrio tubiashii]|uniref:Uncharacterized protein n=1 Tax=Vibrio tubiashii ATCC 19109 TaxID=1051646 RepID=F9T731_9VIBR|nr:hypothetical protein [Vibrio tubiashii]AIW16655.1 hypothetical protein IX91_21490 [Vibrio tubiashii ATCC 19109]EGU54274.1 hypothetical protein VITU9109_12318 [Vibrio tubiashii ATCC 19109]EIF02322.1 hypothetical protein VT1337_19762 [Vibrio tubiashii NCIMB 1337 = ATCC 19106]WCP69005.1 hypothetical protein LYZ37_21000 [Vibrio tubiashii]
MKTAITTLIIAALTSTMASAMPAKDQSIRIKTFENQAVVTVLENGSPVSDVKVKVKGNGTQYFTTGEKGTFMAANLLDHGRSFTFEIEDENGVAVREQRYLTSF